MQLENRTVRVDNKRSVGSIWARPEFGSGPEAAFVLAHGAGAGMDHEFICHFHEAFCRAGFLSVKFNFPYKQAGRKAPDRGSVLEDTYRSVVDAVASDLSGSKIFIGGKSMGGRIASYLVAEGAPVAGAYFLGYPLHAPGRTDRLRTAHFPKLRRPLLFVQGSRDALCDLDLLREALAEAPGPTTLHVVEGGDHSFSVTKKSGRTQAEVRQEVLNTVVNWARRFSTPSPG